MDINTDKFIHSILQKRHGPVGRRRCLLLRRMESPIGGTILNGTRKGGVYDDRTYWNRLMKPVVRRLGLPRWSWHSMRHTFLTFNGLREDLSLPVLQSLAGHASPETTMQYIDKFWREKMDSLEAWSEKLAPLGPMFGSAKMTPS